jgi:hypothetical protein
MPSGNKWKESITYSFNGYSDGAYPIAGVTFGPDGNLYGTTNEGGDGPYYEGNGVAFELMPSEGGWNEVVLHTFNGGSDGAYPMAGVTIDTGGNVFGTTSGDGENSGNDSFGSVFEIVP